MVSVSPSFFPLLLSAILVILATPKGVSAASYALPLGVSNSTTSLAATNKFFYLTTNDRKLLAVNRTSNATILVASSDASGIICNLASIDLPASGISPTFVFIAKARVDQASPTTFRVGVFPLIQGDLAVDVANSAAMPLTVSTLVGTTEITGKVVRSVSSSSSPPPSAVPLIVASSASLDHEFGTMLHFVVAKTPCLQRTTYPITTNDVQISAGDCYAAPAFVDAVGKDARFTDITSVVTVHNQHHAREGIAHHIILVDNNRLRTYSPATDVVVTIYEPQSVDLPPSILCAAIQQQCVTLALGVGGLVVIHFGEEGVSQHATTHQLRDETRGAVYGFTFYGSQQEQYLLSSTSIEQFVFPDECRTARGFEQIGSAFVQVDSRQTTTPGSNGTGDQSGASKSSGLDSTILYPVVVLAILFFVLLVVIGVFLCVKDPTEKTRELKRINDVMKPQLNPLESTSAADSSASVTVTAEKPKPIACFKKGRMIGSGGFGRVFLGLDEESDTLIAAKELCIGPSPTRDTEKVILALQKELHIMKKLQHENVVQYLGADRRGTEFYILMEYVPGGTLRRMIDEFGAMKYSLAAEYTRQMLLGLEYIHSNGIVHRDIKAANVLVDLDGCAKIADFGASRHFETVTGVSGTPYWMSPEGVRGDSATVSWPSDIWSLGCTVIEMLTHGVPFKELGGPFKVMYRIGSSDEPMPIHPGISGHARDFIHVCLQRDPAKRPTAEQLLQHPFITDDHGDAMATSVKRKSNSWKKTVTSTADVAEFSDVMDTFSSSSPLAPPATAREAAARDAKALMKRTLDIYERERTGLLIVSSTTTNQDIGHGGGSSRPTRESSTGNASSTAFSVTSHSHLPTSMELLDGARRLFDDDCANDTGIHHVESDTTF